VSKFKATFDTSGTGDWEIQLPPDLDEHDFEALRPVVQGIKAFLQPTVLDQPVPYILADPPGDLTA